MLAIGGGVGGCPVCVCLECVLFVCLGLGLGCAGMRCCVGGSWGACDFGVVLGNWIEEGCVYLRVWGLNGCIDVVVQVSLSVSVVCCGV